jgi:transcriptional regulator with XRE-family HTH domain
MKTEQRELARRLRRELGYSLGEICREIEEAKSTVSYWVRDIDLTESQKDRLRSLNPIINRSKAGYNSGDRERELRRSWQQDGRKYAAANMSDSLFVAGCMLYWGEGTKGRHTVSFANSDPAMVRFFVEFLRKHLGVQDREIRISCNCFDDVRTVEEIETFWLQTCGLQPECLRKSTINHYSKISQKKRTKALEYGTCTVRVHSTRLLQILYGSIKEIAGISGDEYWLN